MLIHFLLKEVLWLKAVVWK